MSLKYWLASGLALLCAGLVEDLGQLDRLIHRRLDLVEAEIVCDLLDVVGNVVERRGEREDVLAVDRRDERVVQAVEDLVRDAVALVLTVADVLREVAILRVIEQQLLE